MNNPARFLLKFIVRNYCQDFTPSQAAVEVRGLPEALRDLQSEGFISLQENGKYSVNTEGRLVAGRFLANSKGYGFVWMSEGNQFYVAPDKARGLSDGDFVWGHAEMPRPVGRYPGLDIQGLLERANRLVAATYHGNGVGTVLLSNRRVTIAAGQSKGARTGDTVLVRLEGSRWEAVVEEVLPQPTPDLEITNISLGKGYRKELPQLLQKVFPLPSPEPTGRMDFRDKLVLSIDVADSGDVDDAFSVEALEGGGWQVGIHIADVAHWVAEGSALDREAFKRATSVYPGNQVLPMLPTWLSEDACSLLPGKDRLTLSCLARVTPAGEVIDTRFTQGIIRSSYKLNYTTAQEALAGQGPEEIVTALAVAAQLTEALNRRRQAQGAAAINLPVAAFTLEDGQVTDLRAQGQSLAAAVVEELMVLVNHAGACWLTERGLPCLYRIHQGFQPGKEEEVSEFLARFDLPPVAQGGMTSDWLRDLVLTCQGKDYGIAIEKKLVRFMRKSRYSPVPQGHFSLAVEGYAHITSPIRRYSDLVCHRLIKAGLKGEADSPGLTRLAERLLYVAEHCSYRERLAMDIEAETTDLLKCRYMEGAREQVFSGVVVDTIPSGVFVHLDNTAEGFVPGNKIQGDQWFPGKRVQVRVDRVEFRRRQMTFLPAEPLTNLNN